MLYSYSVVFLSGQRIQVSEYSAPLKNIYGVLTCPLKNALQNTRISATLLMHIYFKIDTLASACRFNTQINQPRKRNIAYLMCIELWLPTPYILRRGVMPAGTPFFTLAQSVGGE